MAGGSCCELDLVRELERKLELEVATAPGMPERRVVPRQHHPPGRAAPGAAPVQLGQAVPLRGAPDRARLLATVEAAPVPLRAPVHAPEPVASAGAARRAEPPAADDAAPPAPARAALAAGPRPAHVPLDPDIPRLERIAHRRGDLRRAPRAANPAELIRVLPGEVIADLECDPDIHPRGSPGVKSDPPTEELGSTRPGGLGTTGDANTGGLTRKVGGAGLIGDLQVVGKQGYKKTAAPEVLRRPLGACPARGIDLRGGPRSP